MNRPTFVRTIARWLGRCLPVVALAVTLGTPQPTPLGRPHRPPAVPQVVEPSEDQEVEPSVDLEVRITVNWNS